MKNIKFEDYELKCDELTEGCKFCILGEKLVLFITGICNRQCYYCPLSENRKNRDVIYANERKISTINEAIEEAEICGSKGVGITGGNPILKIDRTCKYLKALKEHFGKDFHAHLYTTLEIEEKHLKKLKEAGLDEIRLHPRMENLKDNGINNDVNKKELELNKLVEKLKLCKQYIKKVGVEIPAIPTMDDEILLLVKKINEIPVDFINLNELEYSETNYEELLKRGFSEKNDYSSRINGSQETALNVINNAKKDLNNNLSLKSNVNLKMHYCPSTLKDSVQMKNRLINRAKNVAKEYEIITDEGLIIKGIVKYAEGELNQNTSNVKDRVEKNDFIQLLEYNELKSGIDYEVNLSKSEIYLNPILLEEIVDYLKETGFVPEKEFSAYISEYYPTVDKLEIQRTPLITKKPKLNLKNRKKNI
ncbi:radical SAM protein [Methanococcus voltae]|uniref:radical SAM protein n=1 Tax=Methanococcus voltae TaxID=2188 RepID=UPI00064FDABD